MNADDADITDAEVALLRARTERLRAPERVDGADDAGAFPIAELFIGGARHAIALASLRAVLAMKRVTPVHLAPPHVVGILRFRGQIITALSLSSLLGGRGLARDPSVLVVVDPGWGHLVALDCESVPRPSTLPSAAVEAATQANTNAIVVDAGGTPLILIERLLDRRTKGRAIYG